MSVKVNHPNDLSIQATVRDGSGVVTFRAGEIAAVLEQSNGARVFLRGSTLFFDVKETAADLNRMVTMARQSAAMGYWSGVEKKAAPVKKKTTKAKGKKNVRR